MRLRIKLMLALALTLVIFLAWHIASILLNMPNNIALAGGFVLAAFIFIGAPWLYSRIFRKKKVNEPEKETHTS